MAKVSKQELAYKEYMQTDISVGELAIKYNVAIKTMYHMLWRERKKLGKVVKLEKH